MKRWSRFLWSVLAVVGGLLAASATRGEDFALQLRCVEPMDRDKAARGEMSEDYILRMARPQYFYTQIFGGKAAKKTSNPQAAAFAKIVKKEPAKYVSDQPFRGVAKLAGVDYAFVIDKKNAESKSYDRLYFDANHNGDLTDDKPIDAIQSRGTANFSSSEFPRVDVTLDSGGSKFDYAFFMTAFVQMAGDFRYASISLNSAAYREGDIAFEGKRHHVILLDYNSNGRFDDTVKIRSDAVTADGQVYPEPGDVLLVDFDLKGPLTRRSLIVLNGNSGNQVSKSLSIDGRFYDMKISPAGDKLTLTPSAAPSGYVTSLHDGFEGVLYDSKQGFVRILCGKSKPAAIPVGRWKLASYTIDRTEYEQPEKSPANKEKKQPKPEKSLLEALFQAVTGVNPASMEPAGPRYTIVSANGTKNSPTIDVQKGKTVSMPFGPPYKPIVSAYLDQDSKKAELSLSIVGASGEVCTDMMVNGDRPPAPEFTVKTPKGETVASGKFKYG